MKQTILYNWNLMRFIRLAAGIAITVQAIIARDAMLVVLGCFLQVCLYLISAVAEPVVVQLRLKKIQLQQKTLPMKKWFSKNILYLAGAFVGAIAGYLYWKFVGCSSGTCAITSKPLNSTIYGAVMGSLLFGFFQPDKSKQVSSPEKNKENDI